MDILEKYIQNIKQYPRITREKEKELSGIILKSKDPDKIHKAKQEMINANLLLVVDRVLKLKNKFNLNNNLIMDLISEGNIALMKVVESYDGEHESNASFGTFAISAIDRKIMNAFNEDKIVHVPGYYFSYRSKLRELEVEFGDKTTDEIILNKLEISKETLDMLREESRGKRALFLEDFFDKENGNGWDDVTEDLNTIDPSEKSCSNSLMSHLDKHIVKLNEREQKVLMNRCLSDSPLSFEQMAESLNISRERVRQVYFAALRKLKNYMIIEWNKNHKDNKLVKKIKHYSYYESLENYREQQIKEEYEFNKKCKNIINYLLNGTEESDKSET